MFSSFFSPLRTSAAVGLALAALTGCGGGSDDAVPPPVSQLAAPADFTRDPNLWVGSSWIYFAWTATPGATHYELHVDPDGPGPLPEGKANDRSTGSGADGFSYASQDSQTFTGAYYWSSDSYGSQGPAAVINRTYRLRACDAQGCGAFTPPVIAGGLELPWGRFSTGDTQSGDGLTRVVEWPYPGNTGVFVFERSSIAQPWQQRAVLLPGLDWPGFQNQALSKDGNTLLVTAPQVPGQGSSVHVYQRTGDAWAEQGLLPSPSDCKRQLCRVSDLQLSADGNVVAAKVGFESNSGFLDETTSAVVIYARDGATWSEQAFLERGNPYDFSLMTLAGNGKTLVVTEGVHHNGWEGGEPFKPSFALVFVRGDRGVWSLQARIPVGLVLNVVSPLVRSSSMNLSDDGNTLAIMAENWPQDRSGRAVDTAALLCGGHVEKVPSFKYMAVFARKGTAWQRQAAIWTDELFPQGHEWSLAPDGNAVAVIRWPGNNLLYTRSDNGTWLCPES